MDAQVEVPLMTDDQFGKFLGHRSSCLKGRQVIKSQSQKDKRESNRGDAVMADVGRVGEGGGIGLGEPDRE